MLSIRKILESIFNANKEKCIVQRLADKLQVMIPKSPIPLEVLLCLVRTRLYIHLRELNRNEREKSLPKYSYQNKLNKFIV